MGSVLSTIVVFGALYILIYPNHGNDGIPDGNTRNSETNIGENGQDTACGIIPAVSCLSEHLYFLLNLNLKVNIE